MKFLESEKLASLSSFLESVVVGDMGFHSKIECWSLKRIKTDKKLAKYLEQQYSSSVGSDKDDGSLMSSSPIGTLTPTATLDLLVDLISTLNSIFADYDFSNATADEFDVEPNYILVINKINSKLSEVFVKHPGELILSHPSSLSSLSSFSSIPSPPLSA